MKRIKSLFFLGKDLALSKTAQFIYTIFLGNIISAFIAFLFTVILVRNLSLSDFGYLSALFALFLLVIDLSDIGIGSSLSAFLPSMERQKKKLFSFLKTAFFLQVSIAFVVSGGLLLFSQVLSDILFHERNLKDLIQITALGIFFAIMANFFQYALSARQKFRQISLLSIFGSTVRLVLVIIAIIAAVLTLTSAVWIQTLSSIFLFTVSLILLKTNFLLLPIKKEDLKRLVTFTYLLGIARAISSLASRLDILMLVSMRGAEEGGIYATASRVTSIYLLLAGSLSMVIAPKLSSSQDSVYAKKFIKKVTIATIGLIGTILLLILLARPFMIFLFAEKGLVTVPVFQLLLVGMIFFVGSIPPVSLAIYFLKKPHILTFNSIIQIVIIIFGNLMLIPTYGRFGAAYSLILAYGISLVITSLMTLFYFKKKV